jgi:isopenicillin-N epimerase
VLQAASPRTRLALIDHIPSQTALIFPIERLVRALEERGIDTLVDAAHAPGMVPVDLDRLGAAYATGNFHKWLCTPKGSAFLHVRRDKQERVRPLVVSHGANSPRRDRSRFRLEFDWVGTVDPTPVLCVPEALRFLGSLEPGGLPALMQRNRSLAVEARRTLCTALHVSPPCPDEMLGAMAAVELPAGQGPAPDPSREIDPLQEALFDRFGVEVPIFPGPPAHGGATRRILRVSTPAYVSMDHVLRLVDALRALGIGA